MPTSTVGYERLFNWGLRIEDEQEFVHAVLSGQPEPPRYFAEMKRVNRIGPPILGGFHRPDRLSDFHLERLRREGAIVVDTRAARDFAAGHVPGTINIPLGRSFVTWAGWLLPYDRDFFMIVDDRCTHCIDEVVRDLGLIGLDRIGGYFGTEAVDAWAGRGKRLATVPQAAVDDLPADATIIDVRGEAEWEAEHIPGATNIPLGYLVEHAGTIPRDRPVAVHCQVGGRSAIAASLLRARGFENVVNLQGGLEAWRAAGRRLDGESHQVAVDSVSG